jgi:rubrerythrin
VLTYPPEAFRLTIRTEEATASLCRVATQTTSDPEAKRIFDGLAREEHRHRKEVQDEYSRLSADPDWDRYSIWRDVI